jgi:hypothetical protein
MSFYRSALCHSLAKRSPLEPILTFEADALSDVLGCTLGNNASAWNFQSFDKVLPHQTGHRDCDLISDPQKLHNTSPSPTARCAARVEHSIPYCQDHIAAQSQHDAAQDV